MHETVLGFVTFLFGFLLLLSPKVKPGFVNSFNFPL